MPTEPVTYRGEMLAPISPPEALREYHFGSDTSPPPIAAPTHAFEPPGGVTYLRDALGHFHTIPAGWVDRVVTPL